MVRRCFIIMIAPIATTNANVAINSGMTGITSAKGDDVAVVEFSDVTS